eukprot:99665-Amorphochlora_amoeboformis.AAC.1
MSYTFARANSVWRFRTISARDSFGRMELLPEILSNNLTGFLYKLTAFLASVEMGLRPVFLFSSLRNGEIEGKSNMYSEDAFMRQD